MILVRSSYAARALQAALLAKNIPYLLIGGVRLLESAHVRDLLSVLRLVAKPKDEIGWMRYLTLWKEIGRNRQPVD
jgi:DNA helicase-2/ATP-dependent DNA helicase PcrA